MSEERAGAVPTGSAPPQVPIQPPPDLASAVLAVVDALVVVLDREGRIVTFNHACERLTGFSAAEVRGRRVWDLFLLEEERPAVESVFASLRAGQFPNRHENTWRRRDGAGRRIVWSNTALLDGDGEVQLVIGTGLDVTEQRAAAEQLRTSEARFRELAEQIREVFWVFDWRQQRVLYVSPAYERVWGRSAAALEDRFDEWESSLHPDDVETARANFAAIAEGRGGVGREYRIVRPDGEVRWISDSGFRVHGPDGEVERLVGIAEDVTERKRAEQALVEAERRSRELVETLREGIWVFDAAGRTTRVNPRMAEMLGVDAHTLLGRRLEEYLDGASTAPECSALFGATPSRGRCDLALRRADGSPLYVGVEVAPLQDAAGEPDGTVAAITDITERVLAERALVGSEATYRTLFEQASDGIWIVEPGSLRVLEANEAAVRQLGHRRSQLRQLRLPDLHEASEWPRMEAILARLEEVGSVVAEVEQRRRDGTGMAAEISSRCTHYNGRRAYQLVVRDISERRRSEQQLRLQGAALASAANAIVITDRDGTVTWVNPAFTRLTGFKPEEVLGGTPRLLRSGEHDPHFYGQMWETILAGQVWQGELVNRRKDGSLYHEEMTITPLRDERGAISHFIAIKQDVSERVRAEARLQRALAEAHEASARLEASVGELERRAREASLLNQMGDLLQTCNNAEEAYAVVARFAPQIFPDVSGALGILTASGSLVEVTAAWGGGLMCGPVFDLQECWCLRRGQVHLEERDGAPGLCRQLPSHRRAAVLCVPLLAQGEPLGLLHLQQPADGGEAFAEARMQTAVGVAERIALSLANLRLRDTLREQAIHDPLTGLYNRRFMHSTLERESRRAVRAGSPMSLILLDLDHFKRVNDTHGHEAGDVLLREVALLLQRSVRGEDVVCRYGGEEFLLVLPGSDLAAAAQRAELLRRRLGEMMVEHRGAMLGPVSASFGVTAMSADLVAPDSLLREADDRLYRAKAAGRDRVEAGPPSEPQTPGR